MKNKKIIALALSASLFSATAAFSQTATPAAAPAPSGPGFNVAGGTLTLNLGVNSDYVFRGYEQNGGKPAVNGGFDFVRPLIGDTNIFIGNWDSMTKGGTPTVAGAHMENDYYAGLRRAFGSVSVDLGYISANYPSYTKSKATENPNFGEYYTKVSFAPDKQPYTLGFQYAINDTGGYLSAQPKKYIDKNYFELDASYDFGTFQTNASYGIFEKDTDTLTLTASKSFYDITFGASYINASKDNKTLSNLSKNTKEYFNLSASKTF